MHDIAYLIGHYGLLIVFLGVFIDKVGVPLPSYPMLLAAGALTLSGQPTPIGVLLVATAAAVSADMLWYAAGARMGRRALGLLCKLSLSPDGCVRRTETMFTRMGLWTLLFAKFVPGLGYVTVALCGITRVNPALFLASDASGAALYVAVPLLLGRIFHDAIGDILATLVQLGEYGLGLVVGAFLIYMALRWIDRQLFIRRLRMDRISVAELASMIDAGASPLILDVRPIEARLHEGMIPGAIGAHMSEIKAVLADRPHNMEIVVYCACPNEASAAIAARHLKQAGFRKIRPLLGGIEAWAKAGRPITLAVAPELPRTAQLAQG